MHARTKLIGTIAIGAVLVAPVGRADSPYDWPGGIHRPGLNGALQSGIVLHPDNRPTPRGPGAIAAAREGSTSVRPDDRGDARGPAASTPTVIAVSTEHRFDRHDALVGAAAGMGAALLVMGCAVLLVSQRSRARAA